eukprot:11692133-Alexandrium_andersonii.AAC.1
MDANAQVGSIRSAAVGSIAPAVETDSGKRLREFMEQAGLSLANTFSPCADALPPATWYSTADKGHRLDYVAIPTAWMDSEPMAYRPTHLDVTLERLDHLPVALEVAPPSSRG